METRIIGRVERTKHLFSVARGSVVDAMEALYDLYYSNDWKLYNENWSDFCEEELGFSKGYASQLNSTWSHYIIEGGVSKDEIRGIDITKLYNGIKIAMPLVEKLKMLRTYSRRQMKIVHNEIAPHEHQAICRVCHIAL